VSAFSRALGAGRWLTFAIGTVSVFLLGASWAISSPLGAGPDEPAHIIKAASVVRGQFLGDLTDEPAVTRVQVPEGLAGASSWPCYAFRPTEDASCLSAVGGSDRLAEANTSAGLYNPVYYSLVGFPSLFTGDAALAVVMMRLVGVVMSSLLLGATLCAVLRLGIPLLTGLGFLAGVTPMVFFLSGLVNPNSMEIAAGAALLASLLVVLRGRTLHPRWWMAGAALSGVFLAQARALSPLWMAAIGVILLLMAPAGRVRILVRRWDGLLTLGVLAAGAAAATAWTLSTGTLGSLGTFPGAGEVSPRRAFFTLLVDRSFDPGIIGVYGWLDTPSPALAYVLWSCLGAGVVILGFIVGRRRTVFGLAVAVMVFFLVPPVVQALSITSSGYIWQGRYGLVSYVVMVLVAGVAVASNTEVVRVVEERTIRNRILWVVAPLFVLGHAFSLATSIKRYVVGLDGDWLNLIRAPLWEPPGGALMWLLLGTIGATGIVLVWSAAAALQRPLEDLDQFQAGSLSLGTARRSVVKD
jgi:hypothetical protein